MLQPFVPLLGTHILCALASPILFSVRAWRSIRGRNPAQGWLRVTPHVVDTLLLLAGIGLALLIRQYPFVNGWLTAKLFALIAYVGAGHVAVRRAHSARGKVGAWLLGVAIVLYIYAVAVSKDPLPGFGTARSAPVVQQQQDRAFRSFDDRVGAWRHSARQLG